MMGAAQRAPAALGSGLLVASALGSFDADGPPSREGLHELIRRFRAGDEAAASAARGAALECLWREIPTWPGPVTAVVVPAHDGGPQRACASSSRP